MAALLPKYVFISPVGEITGAGLILKTEPPYIIGKVFKFANQPLMIEGMKGKIGWCQVFPYSISVAYYRRLDGAIIRIEGNDWESKLKSEMEAMAEWYVKEKIGVKNKGQYKRYLI